MTEKTADTEWLLTEAQAAELLALSSRTLQAWRARGGGPPFVRAGRSVRYKRGDLLCWISENTVSSTSEAVS